MGQFERDFGKFGWSMGMQIAALRRAMDISQDELARSVGLSRGHVSMIENDRRKLQLERAPEFAHALGVQVEDLIGAVVHQRTGRDVTVERDPLSKRPWLP